jgi:hypothetical protein
VGIGVALTNLLGRFFRLPSPSSTLILSFSPRPLKRKKTLLEKLQADPELAEADPVLPPSPAWR